MAEFRNIRSVEEFERDYCLECHKRECSEPKYVQCGYADKCKELFYVGLGYEKCLEEITKALKQRKRRTEL